MTNQMAFRPTLDAQAANTAMGVRQRLGLMQEHLLTAAILRLTSPRSARRRSM
jgi:hypothetical protein